jgi:hypothetical protein
MSRISSVSIVHQPAVCLVTSTYLALVASSAACAGDLPMPPPLGLAMTSGGTMGNHGAGGAYVEGVKGASAGDVGR